MKNRVIFGLLILLTLTGCSNAEKESPQKFSIEIHRWGLLMGADKITTITQDAITVQTMNMTNTAPAYKKTLSEAEKQSIAKALAEIDLDKLKDDYTNNNAPDDVGEYDFTIKIGEKIKAFHIYQVKVDEVFNLVKTINSSLPAEEQVG